MTKLRRVTVMINLNELFVHHHHIYAGIQRYAHEHGQWECSLTPFVELLKTDNPKRTRVDGIIARADSRLAELARKSRIPLVNVWLNSPASGLPSVLPDPKEAGRMAAAHLASRGFKNFGYLGHEGDRSSDLQVEGSKEILGADLSVLRIPRSTLNLDSPKAWQDFQAKLDRWIQSWTLPMAVFTAHDELCRYLAEACREHKLKVPYDVALVGAFNETVISVSRDLSLSSVDYGFERIGYRAAELLDSLMSGKPAPKAPIVLPPLELIARQSSDAFAVENPMVAQALRFIAEKAHTGIGVEEVATHLKTTRRTLARLFKQHMDRSVYATIVHMQVERSKRLLASSSDNIKAVSNASGFSDATHFRLAFRRLVGISPKEFRASRDAKKAPKR